MAVPKRKTTKSRAGMRRSHIKVSSKNIIEDKKSGEYRLSHHLDLKTGFYKGRQVLDPKEQFFMTDHITIAIDAMGGENSPDKTIEGISHHLKNSDNSFYLIFGNEKLINPLIKKYKINSDKYKIIHTEEIIEDTDTALGAAKKGKNTSLWLAMESLKKGESDCVV